MSQDINPWPVLAGFVPLSPSQKMARRPVPVLEGKEQSLPKDSHPAGFYFQKRGALQGGG